jgi:hypothetical protein
MTLKQKKVARLVEKVGSMKEAMLEAGYAPTTAKTPTKVTEAKGWLKLLNEKLPDDGLLTATQEALKADQYDMIGKPHPHHLVRLKAAEQGYKLKGRFAPDNVNQFNVGEMNVKFREKDDI